MIYNINMKLEKRIIDKSIIESMKKNKIYEKAIIDSTSWDIIVKSNGDIKGNVFTDAPFYTKLFIHDYIHNVHKNVHGILYNQYHKYLNELHLNDMALWICASKKGSYIETLIDSKHKHYIVYLLVCLDFDFIEIDVNANDFDVSLKEQIISNLYSILSYTNIPNKYLDMLSNDLKIKSYTKWSRELIIDDFM